MSSGVASSGVSIPNNVRKTINDIKEITGKQHTDEEVFAVLKECSMDPNETAQKLLYLDTFHEVKRRRDRKRENVSSRAPEGFRSASGTQERGALGGRNAVGGWSVGARRQNGVHHIAERSSMPPSLPVSQKMKNTPTPHVTKTSTVIPNGPASLSNGSSSHGRTPQSSAGSVINVHKDNSALDVKELATAPSLPAVDAKQSPSSVPAPTFSSVIRAEKGKSSPNTNFLPTSSTAASVSGVYSSASDPVLVPFLNSRNPAAVGTIKREVGSQQIAAEPNHIQVNKNVSSNVGDKESSKSEKAAPETMKHIKTSSKSKAVEKNQLSEPSQTSSSLGLQPSSNDPSQSPQEPNVPSKVMASDVASVSVDTSSPAPSEANVCVGQHVTFPSHFQVPKALKNGLTFGSFDANFGLTQKYIDGPGGENNPMLAIESSQGNGETAREPSPSNQSVSSNAQDYSNHSKSPPHVLEEVSPSEISVPSTAVLKNDESKEEIMLPPEGPQNPAVQNAPNYSFGVIPPILGSHLVQFEGPESQAQDFSRLPNFVSGNSPALSAPSSTPPVTQSAGVVQSSMNVSPQQVSVFRQPYPPNYIPYPQYFPYFLPQMHQFISHNGIPQQPSSGNVYMPPAAAATGVKFSLPQFKPGTNAGNPTHIGIPFGYSPGPTVTSGSSTGSEDLAASKLKENQIYTTGQLSEGSAVWIPSPGQDISSLQLNSLFNLPPQGQHVNFSPAQAGHGAFGGMYQAAQAMSAPSNVLPLLQQSQPMAGAVDSVGPPGGAYQQPQHAQVNWNTSY